MRVWILCGLLLWLCPALVVGAVGAGLPIGAAFPAGIIASAAVAFLATPRLFRAIALPLSSSRPLRVALGVFTVIAIARIASLSVFMADVRLTDRSMKPADPFRTRHSCMTSCAEAARLSPRVVTIFMTRTSTNRGSSAC